MLIRKPGIINHEHKHQKMGGGLRMHLPLWEGNGVRARDIGQQGLNHGATFNNNAAWIRTKFGPGLDFGATTDTVQCGSNAFIDDAEPLTISVWVYFNAINASDVVFAKGLGSGHYRLDIGSAGSARLRFVKDLASVDINVGWNGSATTGAWNHFVLTWNGGFNGGGGDVQLYKNAFLLTPSNDDGGGTSRTDASNTFQIGGFDGMLVDFRMYKRVLSRGQVLSLYKERFSDFVMPDPVLGFVAAAPAGGRIMSSITNYGGLAGKGGIAGIGGGLAG